MNRNQFLKLLGATIASAGIAFPVIESAIPTNKPWECPFCKDPSLLEPTGNPQNMNQIYSLMAEKITREIDHELLHKISDIVENYG